MWCREGNPGRSEVHQRRPSNQRHFSRDSLPGTALIADGGRPNRLTNARRMRSGSPKPQSRAISCTDAAAALDLRARGLGTQSHDRSRGAGARLRLEQPREIARAHAGLGRELLHREPLAQIAAHVIEQRREAAVGALELEQRRELRLPTRPAVIHHELLRHLARHGLAQILGDERQRQVDARGDAGRAPELPGLHEDAVRIELHARKLPREIVAARPVRGGRASIEQPGGREDIGTRTHAGHAPRRRAAGADELHDARVLRRGARAFTAGDDERVDGRRHDRTPPRSCWRRRCSPPHPRCGATIAIHNYPADSARRFRMRRWDLPRRAAGSPERSGMRRGGASEHLGIKRGNNVISASRLWAQDGAVNQPTRGATVTTPFNVVFALYPRITQLDFTGPYEVLTRLPGARCVLASVDGRRSRGGFASCASPAFAASTASRNAISSACPAASAPWRPSRIRRYLGAIRRLGAKARYITSVCTGSLLLAAAGLLRGKRAACHWAWRDKLADFGVTQDSARVVRDGIMFTGGGVTAGIDMALEVMAEIGGRDLRRNRATRHRIRAGAALRLRAARAGARTGAARGTRAPGFGACRARRGHSAVPPPRSVSRSHGLTTRTPSLCALQPRDVRPVDAARGDHEDREHAEQQQRAHEQRVVLGAQDPVEHGVERREPRAGAERQRQPPQHAGEIDGDQCHQRAGRQRRRRGRNSGARTAPAAVDRTAPAPGPP